MQVFFAFAFTLGFSLCYFACLRLFHLCLCHRFERDLNHLQNLSQKVAKNLKKLEHSQFARFLEKRETVVLTFVFFRLDNVWWSLKLMLFILLKNYLKKVKLLMPQHSNIIFLLMFRCLVFLPNMETDTWVIWLLTMQNHVNV